MVFRTSAFHRAVVMTSILPAAVIRRGRGIKDFQANAGRFYSTKKNDKPLASQVLTCYLEQCGEPPWTSYFVRQIDVLNDQRGMSHFNWPVGSSNYHVLRTGCFPYIKYHCSKRPRQDLSFDDAFFKAIKIVNLGIPTLMYGLAATQLIRHSEVVKTPKGDVTIFFLLPEDKGSQY